MTHIKEIFDLAKLLVEGRRPIDVKLLIHGDSLPVLLLKITNITKDYPVYVNQVRAHYGRSDYNHSFLLSPYDKVEIKPKNTQTFQLGYDGCRIQRHRIASSVPTLNTPPSFSSPADLFRAIANGNPRDSWVEVDFNEFTNKRFARGRLKSILQEMLRMGQNR